MKAVAIVGHGSREKSSEMLMVAELVAKQYEIVETCYLSMTEPGLEQGIMNCIVRGASTVIVIPYFLHMGVHVKKDLPAIIKNEKFSNIKIIMGQHIGFHKKLAEIILERLEEAGG